MEQVEDRSFLAAEQAWGNVWDNLSVRVANAERRFMAAAVVATVAVIGCVVLSLRSSKPFVVVADNLGRTIAAGYADGSTPELPEASRVAVIQQFVDDLRTVTTDGVMQRKLVLDHVYTHLVDGNQATSQIGDWYREHQPQERAKTSTVSVEVNTPLKTSDNRYEVDWTETTRDLYGNVTASEHWKGSFNITTGRTDDPHVLRFNPGRIIFTEAHWSKVQQ